jgi:HD-like signal output (HDOD) protein/signal transduction histidine kinase
MDKPNQSIRNRLLVSRLPAMPQILSKLIELCHEDDSGIGELAKVIAQDAAMSAKVLSVASSSAYNYGSRKVSLVQALNTLGIDVLKTLVISESVFQTFNSFSRMNGLDFRGFWVHSLKAAVLARELAKMMSYPHIDEAYLAGLVHDIGRLALLSVAPEDYSSNFMAKDDERLCSLETSSIGINHSEAGAWLIEQWNLDSFLADSVRYHHEPIARLTSAHPMIRLVCLAHLLSNYKSDSPALEGVGAFCGVDDTDLNVILSSVNSQTKTAASYFGIELTDADQEPPSAEYEPLVSGRDRAQERLAEEVRNTALISSAAQTFSRMKSGGELIESISRTARILFNLQEVIVLLHNAKTHVLTGVPVGDRQQRLSEFSIPLNGGSILAESVLKRKVIFIKSGDNLLGLVEEQLLRTMGTDYLACLPMVAGQSCQGVLVCGLSLLQAEKLWGHERFLLSFSTQAAKSLALSTAANDEIEKLIASVNESHREASRRVSHEVNNPLAIIKNYLSVLDDKMTNNEPVNEELAILNEEIDRVSRIVRGFSELQPQQPAQQDEITEVNAVLNDAVRLFSISRYLPSSVYIVVKTTDQPSEIIGQADTLKQILLNLIKNAVEALPKGGNIKVCNNGRLIRDGRAYYELSVTDNGTGIPSDVMDNLFIPGRSSKSGVDRGLGLSIVQELVKKINGLISCRSGEWGTTFEILIPLAKASSTSDSRPTPVINRM